GPWNEDGITLTPCFQNTVLLGAPALFAIAAFAVRVTHLRQHGIAHGLGKTAILYWPSQFALGSACIAISINLFQNTALRSSTFASLSLLISWVLAIYLNSLEWTFEIRSSSFLFTFELYSVISTGVSLYSLTTQETSPINNINSRPFVVYFYSILTAFVFEAIPRGWTRVQKQSGANPHNRANVFSRWTFHYLQPLISLGHSRPLVQDDIKNIIPEAAEAEPNYQLLNTNWEAHKRAIHDANINSSTEQPKKAGSQKKKPSLIRVIVSTFSSSILGVLVLDLAVSLAKFVVPVLVKEILVFIESDVELPAARGVLLAVAMFATSTVISFTDNQFQKRMTETALKIRGGLISMIYRKSLVLSPAARNNTGEATNHMSTDVERWLEDFGWMTHWITIPVQIVICTAMLYQTLGWSCFCGILCIVISIPVQDRVCVFLDKAKDDKLEAMDRRIQLMTEILANIKIIKLYAYESPFSSRVTSFRDKELAIMRKSGIVEALLSLVYTCFPYLMAFISFAVYATVGGPDFGPGEITTQVIFVSLALFGLLHYPVGAMSMVMESTISLRVGTRRIGKFLLKEEIDPRNIEHEPYLPKDPSAPVIAIENATFAWKSETETTQQTDDNEDEGEDQDEPTETTALLSSDISEPTNEPTLFYINIEIARGHLTAIVGRVGQGKSSLLSALIGDMDKRQGQAKICGSIAYVPQQAWIINGTVQENIVFGKLFDKERYDNILFASGLLPDLEILAAGDQTEIGERGINLSGGQKQRLSLARAAYQDADIYLLDDPLSAVDAHVDQHLWSQLIGPKGLLKNKTRILVTHGINHLKHVDHILVVKNGRIDEQGSYQTLMDAKLSFYQLIKDFSVGHRGKKASKVGTHLQPEGTSATVSTPSSSSTSINGDESGTIVEEAESKDVEQSGGSGDLVQEEEVQDGLVSWSTFMSYCRMMSYYNTALIIATFAVWELLSLSVPLWLERWTSDAGSSPTHSTGYYLRVYGLLLVLFTVVDVYLTYLCRVDAPLQASKVIHENLLLKVIRLPMAFFDTTPQGRVLNRFSNDISSVDEDLPETFLSFLACLFQVVGTLALLCFVTPAFVFVIPFFVVVYLVLQSYYMRTSNVLKRLDSVARSPLYQHFTETLNGVPSIRAMQLSNQFIAKNILLANTSSNATYVKFMNNRWLNIRLEGLASCAILASALLVVSARGKLTPSMCGLALSNMILISDITLFCLREFCGLQRELVSVERLNEYIAKRSEAPAETGARIPEEWPQQGRIVFKNYSTRYREGLDLVVKNVSFEVQPAEKVGIVGRTGAGKSSLTLALFRIIEVADSYWAKSSSQDLKDSSSLSDLENLSGYSPELVDGGSIEIDGMDISTVGLDTLRKNLAIIPQDPTLFVGTVRENLDPSGECSDAELWKALERAHLKDQILSLAGGLSFEVSQNGENFSVGQRSLICLARALLRKTKILILDEATAAVDVETDDLIQRTIRKEFKDRTILTIAHRIKTVMDSDKILVLEKGRVEEYESPKVLLAREGLFHSLAEQAGEIEHP
ncbi:hypothetical protein BG004_001399, partial [Podila humilis]